MAGKDLVCEKKIGPFHVLSNLLLTIMESFDAM
jgi:hypothetical protein